MISRRPGGRRKGEFGGGWAGASPRQPELVNEFLMICRRPGLRRPAEREFRGAAPPTENLNDFPPAGEAGAKTYCTTTRTRTTRRRRRTTTTAATTATTAASTATTAGRTAALTPVAL